MGEMIEFDTEATRASGYLAMPGSGRGPGLLLMHAWWGLTDFFTGLADRLAAEGFVVLAPDLYEGKTTSTIPGAEALIGSLDYREAIKTEIGALDYLLRHPAVSSDRIGAVGFSMGAGYATWLAALRPEIAAVVMFYGGSEQEGDYPDHTQAAFLAHFAEVDDYESLDMARELENRLRSAGREAAFHVYPGTGHWFFENNRPDAYNEEASEQAWQRTIEFLHRILGPGTAK